MNAPPKHLAGLLAIAALITLPCGVRAQGFTDPDFATSVAASSGLGSNTTYNNPDAALGQPGTLLADGFHVSMVYAPYGKDSSGNNTLVSLGTGTVTVQFSTPIVHSAQHWYGDDFILFGNTFFAAPGITSTTDMSKEIITNGGIYQNGAPQVSVSSDGVTFYSLAPNSPYYPTNPYQWNDGTGSWDDSKLNDFTKPINPNLSAASFAGQSVAYAADTLYDGSAGGAAFSLAGLVDADGNPIDSIQYIRFTGSSSGTNNIDAVSRVGLDPAAAPEPSAVIVFALGALGLFAVRTRRTFQRPS